MRTAATRTRAGRAAATLAAGVTLALVAGCSSADEGEDEPYIAIVSKGYQHQYWQTVKHGVEQAAEDFDVEISFEGPASETEVGEQIQQLQTALDREPDAIGLAALDSKAAEPLIERAESENLPIIAFDSGVDSEVPVTTVTTDNVAAAQEAARHMIELTGGEGKVALIVQDQTSQSAVDRRDGFTEHLDEHAPGLEIVDIQYGAGDPLESTDLTNSILQANPDLSGIYATNEGSAIGVVNGVREQGRSEDLAVIGFDSGQTQVNAINRGLQDGAITQDPVAVGYETVRAAVDTLEGRKVEEVIETGHYWFGRNNLDDPAIRDVIYQ